MATINSRGIIDSLIEHHGQYEGDPDVALIVEYENAFGAICWGVTWVTEDPARQVRYLQPTPYVNHPRLLWRKQP